MTPKRIFISGIGVVSPNGIGLHDFWYNSRNGISGIKKINFLDLDGLKTHISGFVIGINGDQVSHRLDITFYDRLSMLVKIAADEALSNAGLAGKTQYLNNAGIILGIAMGGMLSLESCYRDSFVDKTGNIFNEFLAAMPNTPANLLAMEYGAKGINLTVNTACSSSITAIGLAYNMIKNGSLDLCITGGGEAPITPTTIKHFEKLRLLNTKSNDNPTNACRPFNKDRMGIVLSEGSAIIILESQASLDKRGAKPTCEIIGFGSNNDAYHIVAPSVDGEVEAISLALSDAGINPGEVDYIHAHGTGTKLNDKVETEAIKRIYGEKVKEIPISSIKSIIGHTLGASGALSVAITVLSMKNCYITPTINLNDPDPECDLFYTPNEGKTKTIKAATVHSFGFGGSNSILILRNIK